MYLLKGIIIGFAVAAPVGPIGLLCIRRTILFGRWSGLFSGLGAALADTFYGLIAAFGLTLISDFLITHEFWLKVVGGGFLIYIGLKTFFSQSTEKQAVVTHGTLIRDCLSTFLLTFSNPMTIISYLAIFAGLGLGHTQGTYHHAEWLILGVFLGSMFWWTVLSEGVTFFRKRLTHAVTLWINRIAGCLIITFGVMIFASLFLY